MISKAMISGRTHRLMQQNSHDFAVVAEPQPGCAFGLVLDGCGSKGSDGTPAHNEVGAKLLGQFAAAFWQAQLGGSRQPGGAGAPAGEQDGMLTRWVNHFYKEALDFLQGMLALFPWQEEAERTRFVSSHLLATLLGFVVMPETAVLFWQGDGCLVHNEEIILLDSDNRPDYPAYRLLRRRHGAPPPAPLQTRIVHRAALSRLAVATDGWQRAQLEQLPRAQPTLQLQRWTNMQARQRGNFEDDGAIAVWWEDHHEQTNDFH